MKFHSAIDFYRLGLKTYFILALVFYKTEILRFNIFQQDRNDDFTATDLSVGGEKK